MLLTFLKLGGSLITDKATESTPRTAVIQRIAAEIRAALDRSPIPLVLGHGSGSFGHAAAKRYGTRGGVSTPEQWRGFAEVSVMAARLNRIVADALHDAGVPVISFSPSASARCVDGQIASLAVEPISRALERGLVPLVMGDVAFDDVRGGTIVSTEEVFAYLAGHMPVRRILLAGETEGVYRSLESGEVIPQITPHGWDEVRSAVGGSRGADVTGGMASKVQEMLRLVQAHPSVTVRIFSGLKAGEVTQALLGASVGTLVAAEG